MANANQVIINGETILDLRSDTVTPETLQKGYTAHDKSGTKITGTLEASSSGGAKETWVLNNTINTASAFSFSVSFVSNSVSYTGIKTGTLTPIGRDLRYIDSSGSTTQAYGADVRIWLDQAYRKLTFDTPPTGDLLTWLQANGVKQPDNTAVQDTKALTITSNGTVSVTPDAPYDALKKVDVTVDVASGGGTETTSLSVTAYTDNVDRPVNCVWQTGGGWIFSSGFESSTSFTVPDVMVGGYVIFTQTPNETTYFSIDAATGVEDLFANAIDGSTLGGALVLRVTAASPSCILRMRA